MATVKFTRHLVRFFPDLQVETEVLAPTVAEVVARLEARYPGLAAYLVDEQGALRKHVNIFVNQELIKDRQGLSDPVAADDEIHGIPISYAMRDRRTGTVWLCADHGHWGQKLYRSEDLGKTAVEVKAPKYPEGSTIFDVFSGGKEKPASLSYLWTIVLGGDDQPERLYMGTEPGGLFQSDDGGHSFYLNEALWHHPSRGSNWFGGGRDQAGFCSVVVDPRDSDHLFVGVSVGGVYESTDGGQSWVGRNQGLRADYLPDPYAEYGHDPHCTVAGPAQPDVRIGETAGTAWAIPSRRSTRCVLPR